MDIPQNVVEMGYMGAAEACFLDRAEIKFLQILDTLSHIRF